MFSTTARCSITTAYRWLGFPPTYKYSASIGFRLLPSCCVWTETMLAAVFVLGALVGKIPDSKAHGANMGPIWGRQDPGGLHVGPMNWDNSLRIFVKRLSGNIFVASDRCLRILKRDNSCKQCALARTTTPILAVATDLLHLCWLSPAPR